MIPGPPFVFRTPEDALVKTRTLISGNTFGAHYWSDGKCEAPMLYDSPPIRRHPQTGEVFWADDATRVWPSSEPAFGVETPSRYADVPFAEAAREPDLRALLSRGGLERERERTARMRLWWIWNDPQRRAILDQHHTGEERGARRRHKRQNRPGPYLHAPVEVSRPADYPAYATALREVFDGDAFTDRMVRAEIARSLGEHDRAAALLADLAEAPDNALVALMRVANEAERTHIVYVK